MLSGCAPVTLGGSGGDGATGGTMRRCRGLVGGHVSVPGATGRRTPLVSNFGGGGVGAAPPATFELGTAGGVQSFT